MTDVVRPEEIKTRCSIDKEEIECYGCETPDSTCSCVRKKEAAVEDDAPEEGGCCGGSCC